MREVPTLIGQRMWRLSMIDITLRQCYWMCRRVLFPDGMVGINKGGVAHH
jgi:hypothetical protein